MFRPMAEASGDSAGGAAKGWKAPFATPGSVPRRSTAGTRSVGVCFLPARAEAADGELVPLRNPRPLRSWAICPGPAELEAAMP
mgnify:CR=1 FL=1